MSSVELKVPDIGDFDAVEVIEILITEGDAVEADQSLITLESDKAAMEIPAETSGTVTSVSVKVGDKISQGDVICHIEPSINSIPESPQETHETTSSSTIPSTVETHPPQADMHCDVMVLGAGPGGYTAAFRAADLGKKVILIERHERLGGVCLNVGCIPSKALLHISEVINESQGMHHHGIAFNKPEIDIDKLRTHKESVVNRLTGGLSMLAKQRKVEVVHGQAQFNGTHTIEVTDSDGHQQTIAFENAIIAAGSSAVKLPFIPHDDPRIMTSTGALSLAEIPERLLVIGGGIIGLEMAQVYDALGTEITVVELGDNIIPGADKDITRPLFKIIKKKYKNIFLKTKVTHVEAKDNGLHVSFEGSDSDAPESDSFDRVLVAVGRTPNGKNINAEAAGIAVNDWGFIEVNERQETNVAHIYAIGDIVGQPMLAHKAVHEGKVAAEVIAGENSAFTPMAIPSVAYTDPEIAWAGKTETELKSEGIEYEKGAFPWAASGRSLSLGRDEGITKALFDKKTHRLLGVGIVGPNAGELIAEAMLAIEMGADMSDIGLTIHPHPTLSETLGFAAEMAEGTITDLMPPKKR